MSDATRIQDKRELRWEVFIPGFVLIGAAAVWGLWDNKSMTATARSFFRWTLLTFGWAYALVTLVTLLLVLYLMFSKIGSVRIGGRDAEPKYPFWTWFAMTLTGGVAVGIVTWSVNEPLIYYGNVYRELDALGIAPGTPQAAQFAMARCFHNWTFIPYAIYALSGVLMAYIYYNKKDRLAVTSTLKPLLGDWVARGVTASLVDTLSMMAIILGLTSGLTMCITLLTTGVQHIYGLQKTLSLFVVTGIFIVLSFTTSTYVGLDKGMKKIAGLNAYFYYGLMILLVITGPSLFIVRNATAGLATWLNNFWLWSLDPVDIAGVPLNQFWTLYDWALWVAYAPVTGIFLAMIARGRTIREFLIVNLVLPAVFGLVWFSIWGNSALSIQMSGGVDLVATIKNANAVTALWEFLRVLPFNLGYIVVPINLFVIYISYVTAANATTNSISSMCIKDVPIGSEAPGYLKVLWGVIIGAIAIIMAAFGGTEQGVEGVKSLGAAGGFVVLFIFILQVCSAVKLFLVDDVVE